MEALRSLLRSEDPTAMTTFMSSMLASTDAFPTGDPGDPDEEPIPLDAILEPFLHTDYAETTAALHAIAALLPDELDAARVRRVLATRRHPLPEPVVGVKDVEVVHAAKLGDDLGDGDNVILGLAWPGTTGVSVVVYVDEAFGTRIKDVFLLPMPFEETLSNYRRLLSENGRSPSELAEVALADAAAALREAIELGDAPDAQEVPEDWSGPDGEDLGWPAARPFVEMLLRRMPSGGTSVLSSSALPEVSVADAVSGFVRSDHRAGGDVVGLEQVATLLARDAATFAGHPLRWSPVQVELALTQRLPFTVGADAAVLARVPEVLPGFIRYAHGRLAVPADATEQTLAAVDEWAPVFEVLRAAPSAVEWREVGGLVEQFAHGDVGPLMLRRLADEVGGPEALDRLDAEPLASQPLTLDEVAVDVRDRVVEIDGIVERWLSTSPHVAHLGTVRDEWLTAARRLLLGASAADPGWLRRRASPDGRACGLLWLSGVVNGLVGPHGAVLVKDLAADFGVTGAPSAKADALLNAWRVAHPGRGDALGDARILVSTRRAALIAQRDRYRG